MAYERLHFTIRLFGRALLSSVCTELMNWQYWWDDRSERTVRQIRWSCEMQETNWQIRCSDRIKRLALEDDEIEDSYDLSRECFLAVAEPCRAAPGRHVSPIAASPAPNRFAAANIVLLVRTLFTT